MIAVWGVVPVYTVFADKANMTVFGDFYAHNRQTSYVKRRLCIGVVQLLQQLASKQYAYRTHFKFRCVERFASHANFLILKISGESGLHLTDATPA